jgi:hypothetical protein
MNDLVNNPLPIAGPRLLPGFGFGRARLVAPFGGTAAAAKYLGLTTAQLRKQLQSGKSLADIAKAQGKTTQGLEQALTAAAKARLDKAVAKKKLTADQEQKLLKAMTAGIDATVNGTGPRFAGPGFGYHKAFRGGFARPGSFVPAPPPPGSPIA